MGVKTSRIFWVLLLSCSARIVQAEELRVVANSGQTLLLKDIAKQSQFDLCVTLASDTMPVPTLVGASVGELRGRATEQCSAVYQGLSVGNYSLRVGEQDVLALSLQNHIAAATATTERQDSTEAKWIAGGASVSALGFLIASTGTDSGSSNTSTGLTSGSGLTPIGAPSAPSEGLAPGGVGLSSVSSAPNPGTPSPAPGTVTVNGSPTLNGANGPVTGTENPEATPTAPSPAGPPSPSGS